MRIRTLALAVAAVLASTGGPVRGQSLPTVAVMDFNAYMMGDGGAAVSLGKAISTMLVTELSGREGIQVIERSQLNDLIREQDLNLSGRIAESDAIEVGRMLGAQYVIHGGATAILDQLRMDVRAVNVETSEIVTVHKETDLVSELFAIVVALADEFGAELDLVAPTERPEVQSIPIGATIAFSRAVDYEDLGQIDDAIEQYEATLELHPNHREARLALDRLRGGISG